MKKRTLYIAVGLIMLSWVIGPMSMQHLECYLPNTQADSFILYYPDGTYMFIQKTASESDYTKWAVKVFVPEDIDIPGTETRFKNDSPDKILSPDIMGIYSENTCSGDRVIDRTQKWIPQTILIILFGFGGFIFAAPKRKEVNLIARN